MIRPSLDRHISPYLAILIITIFGSVMTTIITRVADTVIIFENEAVVTALYLP